MRLEGRGGRFDSISAKEKRRAKGLGASFVDVTPTITFQRGPLQRLAAPLGGCCTESPQAFR
jgi:hypothetical protein